ncbi:hypothetical protein DFJ58DRAFT_744495 [Suillus subalutaceus]|uniref:uncharacterized protein n=1 Tax=Suillus subalutaceus TaxID=48586 RepID=UPI001B860E73|nr:uncharacterized protein DFJ58DRAFT_744495 [Suillus subalutaceus]KAG1860298.1 hypothetical protein DFJ58DRAFT_744495 [Suillus subalutaceus]
MNLCNVCVSLETSQYDSESLLTASVPPACTRSRGTLIAAEFQNLYGLEVAAALRTPPVISAPPLNPAAVQASKAMSLQWISASVDDPARRLEKLKRTDIQICIPRLAPRYRTLYNKLSHRKTCDALIIPSNAYCTYFMLEQVFWAVFCQILAHEFGVLVTERLSQEIVSRFVKDMSARLECKQNALAEQSFRRMQLLPCAAYTKKALHDPKGKRKVTNELGGQSPAKNSKLSTESHDIFDIELEADDD